MKEEHKTTYATRIDPQVTRVRAAGPDHHVITIEGGKRSYRRKPCESCPWRIDATGQFPAECFRATAPTAYNDAQATFACHESGARKPALCAGFLLHGAEHNATMQRKKTQGARFADVKDGGHRLHATFRAMAIANGVSSDDPVLAACHD